MIKFAITMANYNRIYHIIHGIIKDEGFAERGCTFFSIVGSYLLNKKYGIKARSVAGSFALCVDNTPKCISYGKEKNGIFS